MKMTSVSNMAGSPCFLKPFLGFTSEPTTAQMETILKTWYSKLLTAISNTKNTNRFMNPKVIFKFN
jgi:hypothetical protein